MSDVTNQRKLLIEKLKERGVSVTNPLFEHGMKVERLAPNETSNNRSSTKRAKYSGHNRGHKFTAASTQQTKVIVKHIPITLSIAELAKASGMFKGTGGTRNEDRTNKVADEFAKTHPNEAKKSQTNMQYYYAKVGKSWTKKSKKPIDSPES